MKNSINTEQQGFTIIELVVAILLLAILTATALPRFVDVTGHAHAAVTQDAQGRLQSGTATFRAAWATAGEPPANTRIEAFGDGSLLANAAGYPKGDNTRGITNDLDGANECALIYSKLLEVENTATISPTAFATVPTSAQLNADSNEFVAYVTAADVCNFAYSDEFVATGDAARVITYDSLTGTVALGWTTRLQ